MRKSHSTVRLDIDRVREQIAHHGYKYSALADSVGVSTNAIKNWLSGRTRTIYRKNAVLLATAFHCAIDDILLADSPPPPSPAEPLASPVISSIFDHHIKVFGLVKAAVTGPHSARHIAEVRSIFANILASLDADTENFGHCQVFVFNALHQTLPAKQVAHALDRLSAFQRLVGEVEERFADHRLSFRMVLALSDGNSSHNGLCSADAYGDNLGKLLEYVDALEALPAGAGLYCDGYFQELAASAAQSGVTLGTESATALQLVRVRFGEQDKRAAPRPEPSGYVLRHKLAEACAAAKHSQHLHVYGDMGSGKSLLLRSPDSELAGFIEGYRRVGPIFGAEHYRDQRPAVLALVATYIDTLMAAGKTLAEIKAFIQLKCADISPVIDSVLLSMLGHEPFGMRDRFFNKAVIDTSCHLAIIRIMQLDSRVYRSVLLVDDSDALDPFSKSFVDFFWAKLPALEKTKLVTTGSCPFQPQAQGSKAKYSHSLKLENFSLAETRLFFRDGPLAVDTIGTLHQLTKGHPLLLGEVKQRWWDIVPSARDKDSRGEVAKAAPPLALSYSREASWDTRHHGLIDELKAANKPHQTIYFLLARELAAIQIEALQILAVAGFCRVDAAIITHLEWSFSGEKKLSEVLDQIAAKERIITRAAEGYRFCHGLFHLAFKLSVTARARQKIHLVLHSYWEGEYARRQAQGTADLALEHEKLLVHSRGAKLYNEFGRYACRCYDHQLRAGQLEGLSEKVTAVVKVLTKVTPTVEIRDSLCQLFLLKAKITFLAAGWTHPDILKYILSCESHDTTGAYQPIIDLMKIYYYTERGNSRKVGEIFLRIDGKALRENVPVIYVAILCIYSSSTFMAGQLAKCVQTAEEARQLYDAIGQSEPFITHLDLDYGVWIYGSLAVANLIAGNKAKTEEYLHKGRQLTVGQDHLSTLGCFLLFESMVGALTDQKHSVRKRTKHYLRKTAQLKSAQATIWPLYYWSVGNVAMMTDQIEQLKAAGNNLLVSFFLYLAAGLQWQRGDKIEARQTIGQALTFERQVGQSFVTKFITSKSELGSTAGERFAGPRLLKH